MKASDIKKSSLIEINGMPHKVEHISIHSPTARGGSSTYKVRMRNVQTGNKLDESYKGDDTVKEADLTRTEVQFLYKNGDDYTFMDLESYDQFDLKSNEIEEAIPYLVDDLEGIIALISNEKVIGIQMPDTMELPIITCDPSIKGASATARTKPATLSTGLVVQVPEYISQDDVIKIDTRTNVFLSRA